MDYIPNNFKSLSELFDVTLSDLKGGIPLWDDLVIKITRLHASLRSVVQANSSFLEAFQRIADLATNSNGLISKDIGTSLTRLSLRQRSLHSKMKAMNENMGCKIIDPMQQRLDEWKKNNLQLDKDRIKETRRAKSDLKKASDEKNRLQRKAMKRGSMKGLGPLQMQVEVALKEAADKYQALESIEYDCVRRVLIEERSRFCYFISCLMPVLECQLHMFSEIGSLQELKDQITVLTENPHSLTQAAEDLIKSIIKPLSLSSADTMLAATLGCSSTPPASMDAGSSEGSLVSSRKSSVLSINSEASSSHSGGVNNNILSHRRSHSSSPNNALIEHESDDIFISDGKCEKLEYESTHYSQLDQPDTSANNCNSNNNNNNNTSTNCDVTNARDYDSVTLKRPKGTAGKGLHSEDDLVMLANLAWQPDTPNVNANYSALYQLHQPIPNQSNYPRKNSAGPTNGNMYPEYNTIHSCSPSSKPRRMTVPELPVSVQTYATLKHQARINVMHPPNVHLDQIDECRLPPNPNEDSNYGDDHDMPMPPPPSVDNDAPSGQLKGQSFVASTPLQNLTQQQHAPQQHALHQHVPTQHAPQQHAIQKHNTHQHASQQHLHQQHIPQQHAPQHHMPQQHAPQQQLPQQHMSQQHAPQQHMPQQHASQQQLPQQHMPQQHAPQQHMPQQHAPQQQYSSYGATKPAFHMTMSPVPPPPPCAPPPLFQTVAGKCNPSIPAPPPLSSSSSQPQPQPTNTSHVNIPRPPCNAPIPPPPPPPPAPPAPPFFTMKRVTKQ